MSNRGEIWVHGNSVVCQYPGGNDGLSYTAGHRMLHVTDPANSSRLVPWSDIVGMRSGLGATFRGSAGTTGASNTNWFHFSIPTPAIFPQINIPNHLEITIDAVSMYYRTPNDQITIQAVTVTDGQVGTQGIPSVESAHLHGDHTARPEPNLNTWGIRPIRLRLGIPHGVLISTEVRFDIEGAVTFTAAAIHYQVG